MSELSASTPERQEVHCAACSRIVLLPAGSGEGSVVTCPFCHTKMIVRLKTVYVAEPLVEA
jgi:DNA-directed RNA polymerase subunit RPC12/RpoP